MLVRLGHVLFHILGFCGVFLSCFEMTSANARAEEMSRFQAPELQRLFVLAQKHSPQLASLATSRQALQSEIQGLQAQRWINMDASLSNGNTLSTLVDNSNLQTSVQFTNHFDIANRQGFEIQLKEIEVLKNHYQAQLERRRLFLQLAKSYYRWLLALQIQDLHQKSVQQLQEQVQALTQGVSLGKERLIDRERLQLEWLQQKQVLLQDQLELAQRRETLSQLLGLTFAETFLKPHFPEADLKFAGAQMEQQEALFLEKAPDLGLIVLDHHSTEVRLHQTQAGAFPQLNLSELYQLNTVTPKPEALQQVLLSLDLKLFDGARGPQIEAEQSKLKALDLDYLQTQQNLQTQFRNQWHELQTLTEQRPVVEQALELARRNYAHLRRGYQRHFVDLTTLLGARRDWLAAELKRVQNHTRVYELWTILQAQIQGDIFQ